MKKQSWRKLGFFCSILWKPWWEESSTFECYQKQYYEATFFYNEQDILLTISEDLEQITGNITEHPQYTDILKIILKQIVPFSDMYDRIDPVDFKRWVEGVIEVEQGESEEINPEEITIVEEKKDTE